MKTQNLLMMLILLLSLGSMGCGATKIDKNGATDLASRVDPRDDNTMGIGHGKLAECNQFTDTVSGLKGYLSTYYDPATGYFVHNYIRMALQQIPTQFFQDSNNYIQFFRWSEDIPDHRITNPAAVPMIFFRRGTGAILNRSKPVNTLSQASLNTVISDYGLSSQGITPQNFFDSFFVILTDFEMQYDAVTMAFYNHLHGTSAQRYVEALVPAFSADPNRYASNHPAPSLQQLHPLYKLRNSGYTETLFFQQTEYYCQGFF